jgi:hypothetical protein
MIRRAGIALICLGAFKVYSDAKSHQKWEAFKRVHPDYALLSKEERDSAWDHYFRAHPEFNTWEWWLSAPQAQERK